MLLNESIAKNIKKYPTLYRDINYQLSRVKVLNHFFLTNGNGMSWWDGFLSDENEEDWDRDKGGWYGIGGPKYKEDTFKDYFSKNYFTSNKIAKGKSSRSQWSPYPISKYSLLIHVPDNVKLDWLLGADEICQYTIQFYNDKSLWKYDSYYQEIGNTFDNGKVMYTLEKWLEYKDICLNNLNIAQTRIDKLLQINKLRKTTFILPVWENPRQRFPERVLKALII